PPIRPRPHPPLRPRPPPLPPYPRPRLLRLFAKRKPADPAPQRNLPSCRAPALHQIRRLTQQEAKAGLLADPATIGTRTAWLARLQAHRLTLRGHRLVQTDSKPIRPGNQRRSRAAHMLTSAPKRARASARQG